MNEAVQLFEKELSVITTPLAKQLNPNEVLVKVSVDQNSVSVIKQS